MDLKQRKMRKKQIGRVRRATGASKLSRAREPTLYHNRAAVLDRRAVCVYIPSKFCDSTAHAFFFFSLLFRMPMAVSSPFHYPSLPGCVLRLFTRSVKCRPMRPTTVQPDVAVIDDVARSRHRGCTTAQHPHFC